MRHRGFTFLEAIVVLAIIIILVSLITPVLIFAKQKASITSSVSRLRQLHLAAELYREGNETGGYTLEGLGLPPVSYVYSSFFDLGREFFISPCGYKAAIEGNSMGLSYQYTGWPHADAYFMKHQENSILFRDPHCTTPEEWNAEFRSKRGLAVTLGGRLVNMYKPGKAWNIEWWTPLGE